MRIFFGHRSAAAASSDGIASGGTGSGVGSGVGGVATGVTPSMPTITAPCAHIINLDTGVTLYEKGTKTAAKIPASMTKMVMAWTLLQYKPTLAQLQETFVITTDHLGGSSQINYIAVNQTWTLHALLAYALLPSCNEACLVIANKIGSEIIAAEGGSGTGSTRFITEMNTRAAALGMTDSVFYDASGESFSSETTPRDMNKVLAALAKNKIVRDIWRYQYYNVPLLNSSGVPQTLAVSFSVLMCGDVGVIGGKTGSYGTPSNLALLWEAPNGQLIALTEIGSTGDANRYIDMRSMIAALPSVYPELADTATPFTPARLFDTLGYEGGWFDSTDTSNMWQDDAGTTAVTATGQSVGKWSPKAGNASIYWRQATSGKRPLYQSSGIVFDGVDDFFDLGSSTFGSSRLFADAADKFMVAQRVASSGATGTFLAKAGATATARNFHSYMDTAGSRTPGLYVRGGDGGTSAGLNDGAEHGIGAWWDGSSGAHVRDELGGRQTLPGTAAEQTTQNILLGAINGGASYFLTGTVNQIVLVDDYDIDSARRLRDWLNGATINAYPSSASQFVESAVASGGVGSGVGAGSGGEAAGQVAGTADGGTGSGTGSGTGGEAAGEVSATADGGTGAGTGSGTGGGAIGEAGGSATAIGGTGTGTGSGTGGEASGQVAGVAAGGVGSGAGSGTGGAAVGGGAGVETWPSPSDVRLGVTYGPTGVEYIGTLAEGGASVDYDQIAAAVLAALNATTIPVDVKRMNAATVIGDGTLNDLWRGA